MQLEQEQEQEIKCDMLLAVKDIMHNLDNSEVIISTSAFNFSNFKTFKDEKTGQIKKYLKVFLFDNSVNANNVQLDNATMDKHAYDFINYPLILNSSLDHSIDDEETIPSAGIGYLKTSITKILEKQKDWIVGIIKSIHKTVNGPSISYHANVELTDKKFIKTIEDNPQILDQIYTSSSLVGRPVIKTTETGQEILLMNGEIKPLNISIVADPAYGKIKSMIRGYCSGPQSKCMSILATASAGNKENKLLNLLSNINNPELKNNMNMTESIDNEPSKPESNITTTAVAEVKTEDNKNGEPELTLEDAKKLIKKYEVELSLKNDQISQIQTDSELIKKHEQELKEYRLKDKIHKFSKILSPMIKDTKKLEERATEYAKDENITEKFLEKIVNDSLLIVSTSSINRDEEEKNDMLSLADSLISTSSIDRDEKKPYKGFNESIAGFYSNLL